MTHKPEGDRPRINISQHADNSENVTQIGQAGDVHIGDRHHTGDNITVGDGVSMVGGVIGSGSVQAENIAGGNIAVGTSASPEVKQMFEQLNALSEKIDNKYAKQAAQQSIKDLQAEIDKGEEADEEKVEYTLGSLSSTPSIAEDVIAVIGATLTNPAAGIAEAIRRAWARFKGQS